MKRDHSSQFSLGCQRRWGFAVLIGLCCLAVSPAFSLDAPSVSTATAAAMLSQLSLFHFNGTASFNWRNVGPRHPGYETQIQNEVYLADMYLGVSGPLMQSIPFQLELHWPTAGQGSMQLFQAYIGYEPEGYKFRLGKFVVPFGRYNELYHADDFLTVTRPLLYASPDSLDLVVRPNSPRPPFSAGYTDIGARVSYYPSEASPMVPEELTAYILNGLGETNNRQRTFPDPGNLGIANVPTNGSTIDFGHLNNNLADNNNAKSIGGRAVFALGDVRLPWPFPESRGDLTGVSLGLSGIGGQFDLEGQLNYQIYGLDFSFDYAGFSFSGEYIYDTNNFLAPVDRNGSAPLVTPISQSRQTEFMQGYFIQAAAPLVRKPLWGQRVTGILVFNQMFRRGPQLDLLLNYNDGQTTYPSLLAYNPLTPFITTRIDKYTAAINYKLTDHFTAKFDYSCWMMHQATNISPSSLGTINIYQGAFSLVVGF